MIYISKDRMKSDTGRGYSYRVFCSTREEMNALISSLSDEVIKLRQAGHPNEHIIVNSTCKGKLVREGAEELSQKGLLKFIRTKRKGEVPGGTKEVTESLEEVAEETVTDSEVDASYEPSSTYQEGPLSEDEED